MVIWIWYCSSKTWYREFCSKSYVSKLLFDQPVRIFADSTSITIPIYWCKVITAVQIEKVELKFCERIRNRRMRKEDAYMASMQSFAMRASFQLPVEIVLEGDRPVKSETFMIWMWVLIDNAPMSEKTKDQLVCMLMMSGFVILFWGIKGYREKKKTEE